MNVPNILTILRLFLIPIYIIFLFSNLEYGLIYSIIVFIISGFTDILDGYIARKNNQITKLGTVLDPLADKLMLLSVLISLTIKGYVPIIVPIIILTKESIMILVGIILYKKDAVIPSNIFGKLSTFLFYIAIITLCFSKTVGVYMLYGCVLSSLIAFISYTKYYFNYKQNS